MFDCLQNLPNLRKFGGQCRERQDRAPLSDFYSVSLGFLQLVFSVGFASKHRTRWAFSSSISELLSEKRWH
jgi:hypothetical protein